MKAFFLIGRLVFGGFFLYNGINHLKSHRNLARYAKAKHVPIADFAVPATGVLLLIGGTSLLLGIKPKIGALAIISFLAGVSPLMHNFWAAKDPEQRQTDMIMFGKNIALLGATLALMSVKEPWPASIPVSKKEKYQTRDIVAA